MFTCGICKSFNSFTKASLSGINSVSAAMSISPAAPMLHSKYNVFIVVDSFMFLSFYMHFSIQILCIFHGYVVNHACHISRTKSIINVYNADSAGTGVKHG